MSEGIIGLIRAGWRLDPRPDADLPLWFVETVGDRPERWTEELVAIHNPRALHPLPADEVLPDVTNYRQTADGIEGSGPAWHVFSSSTITLVPQK